MNAHKRITKNIARLREIDVNLADKIYNDYINMVKLSYSCGYKDGLYRGCISKKGRHTTANGETYSEIIKNINNKLKDIKIVGSDGNCINL